MATLSCESHHMRRHSFGPYPGRGAVRSERTNTSARSHQDFSVADCPIRPIRVRITRTRSRKPSPPLGRYPQLPLWDQIGSTPRNNTPNMPIRIILILILLLFARSPHSPPFGSHAFCGHTFLSPDNRSRSLCMAVRPASAASVRTARLSLMNSRPLSSA